MTVVNGQKMNCYPKIMVNVKLQVGETVKLNGVLYVPQEVNNLVRILRLVSKGVTTGSTKYKITVKKNGVSKTLDSMKVKNDGTIFYLKAKVYASEFYSPREANSNLPEEK